ncbi:UNVERIFIED_CONTAM: LINE-1 reverse transcriptase [Sesamum latifolium]|uniref:LINE-1 reverse transcriptase n=1 Tax=Sesamum latifolium TaxID=2727402 RepID=A0AAW2TB89_9LAMI
MLANEAWFTIWPLSSYYSASPRTSDHSPLILQGQNPHTESSMFRFENFMAKVPGFQQLVTAHWQYRIVGTAMYSFRRKTKQQDLAFLQPFVQHIITEDEATMIIVPVRREEVKEALFDINEDSAPGPDDFSSGFYKLAWPVVGDEFCNVVLEFFEHGRILKQLNTTLITLIPKVQMPLKVGDFRPISCCNVIYKIITKVLVKQMQVVLDKLIDNSQNAFVPGRSISDNILLAQELLSGYNQKRLPPRCTIKVDLQKAYDMVNWDYLLAVLHLFNFPDKFIGWVEQCITTASFSDSLNGGIHRFFMSSRGLRQGDPISPYLFVLVMEALHLHLKSMVLIDANFQFHWRCKELSIVNLSFADDLLLFCKADIYSISVLHKVLEDFKEQSGLQANATKSRFILSKVADHLNVQISTWLSSRNWMLKLLQRELLNPLMPNSGIFFGKELQALEATKLLGTGWAMGNVFKLWLDPWHPDDLLLHKLPDGPRITGLSMKSELHKVISGGEWHCLVARRLDIIDIISRLPSIYNGNTDRVLW